MSQKTSGARNHTHLQSEMGDDLQQAGPRNH